MNHITQRVGALLTALTVTLSARAQFASGSDGTDGALNITASGVSTLVAPDDGVFNFTTVDIASGSTLNILPNPNNTPIYLLATGDIRISGIIDVSGLQGNSIIGGRGGAGGFRGGNPASDGQPAADGLGPGAGRAGAGSTTENGAGAGAHATKSTSGSSTRHGDIYGSAMLIPGEGGSGGGGTPTWGGGGGGGAITVASTTQIDLANSGRIDAYGGSNGGGAFNGGSGGSIRLVAPIISGTGQLRAFGQGGGGQGRVRVDVLDRSTVTGIRYSGSTPVTIGSMMVVRPSPFPRLDIITAAGTEIPLGSGPVQVIRPFGSSPNVKVTVQAQNFNSVVPITLALAPDSGPTQLIDATIDNAAANPATVALDVTLPLNVLVTINVWTRNPAP